VCAAGAKKIFARALALFSMAKKPGEQHPKNFFSLARAFRARSLYQFLLTAGLQEFPIT
jgi:hypothetical protein